MTREEALKLLKENLQNQNLIKHSLAVEAIMRALAQHFNEDEEKWGLVGLLHDIDYEKTKGDPVQHSMIGAQMLKDLGLEDDVCRAVKVHNEAHSIPPQTLMEKALYVADPLTGLIVAATLVLPSKKIADLETESILKRFKEKTFAKGANREIIKKCEDYLNLSPKDFVEIGKNAMQEISDDIGL